MTETTTNKTSTRKRPSARSTPAQRRAKKQLKIIPLGGLHEIGKNMTLLEYGDDIIVIDCGVSFPGAELYGIDSVIPDFSYLVENAKRVKGLIVTHAHEDHIGGIPYLLKRLNIPVYGSRLTIGFIKRKLKEHKITGKLVEIEADESFKLGCFTINPIHITHSVSDAFAFNIETPIGTIFHTGDFKVDYTPLANKPIDLAKMAKIGNEGLLLLMADSTNAMRKGYTSSEQNVGVSLANIFASTPHRIIIATFSSNIDRVQRIIDIAVKHGRKVAISGRSMENNVEIAQELGYLNVPKGTLISLKQLKLYKDSEAVIISTGSQGEPMSALYRMATGEHKDVVIRTNDVVILSSSPVPGNEVSVNDIVNALMERGAQVIYNEIAETHVSGHACEEELKLIHALLKPKFFMPVHGEVKHLVSHANIAQKLGMLPKNIVMASNGSIVELSKDRIRLSTDSVPAFPVLVDGLGIGDVGAAVLNERKALSEGGIVVLSAVFDSATNELLSGPTIKSKGLIYVKEYGQILDEARKSLEKAVTQAYKQGKNRQAIEKLMTDTLKKYIATKINRNPVILSMFMEV